MILVLPPIVRFGPFFLDIKGRSLLDGDIELRLGARALDLLIALIERAGELVTHQELLLYAWTGASVDESSLRVHMSALRKALGDGQSGARYILNEHGRGYRFVGQLMQQRPSVERVRPAVLPESRSLPAQIVKMLGREDAIQSLSGAVQLSRLVTIAGPGGIGKSTLAIGWARRHADRFKDGVRFVDLLPINNAESAARWISTALGVGASGAASPQQIAAALGSSEMLIVLDNCEHVIEFAADFAEALLAQAPEVCIIATSREPLLATGETLYRLKGLSFPAEDPRTLSEAILYPAVELFLERAAAGAPSLQLTDEDIGVVSDLVRRLDGIPLAIELAACWTDVVGIRDLATQLDASILSHTEIRRTAIPRHRSLAAALEWSYSALDQDTRLILNRLAVFQSSFTLADALAVASAAPLEEKDIIHSIAVLARKSLLQVDISGEIVRYRLLETTKAYAWERLAEVDDVNAVRAHHAQNCFDLLEGAEAGILTLGWNEWLSRYGDLISDTRAALNWAFSEKGDAAIGTRLTLRSLPFGQQFPLSAEYLRHIDAALEFLRDGDIDAELAAISLGFARGTLISNMSGDATPFSAVATRSKALERQAGGAISDGISAQFGAAITSGNYPETLDAALRMEEVVAGGGAVELELAGMRMRAQAEHFLGRHHTAEKLALEVLAAPFEFLPLTPTSHKVSMRIILARIAFLKGMPGRARTYIDEALDHAGSNPSAICQTLGMAGVPLGFWVRDYDYAQSAMERMASIASRSGLAFWGEWSTAFEAALSLSRDGKKIALPDLSHMAQVADLLATFHPGLLLPEAIRRVDEGIVGWNAPEVIRARAMAASDAAEAATLAKRALALARQQAAPVWERRALETLDALS